MKIYKLQYLALKNLFRSRLKILQGVGFLKKVEGVVQSLVYLYRVSQKLVPLISCALPIDQKFILA